mmetsp:Transcript_11900/g.13060  ORF Transcript_11900/g.13060 Transcript_11900/m.13060 type:complete len:212 (+) Transcript_11900:306-941(+)
MVAAALVKNKSSDGETLLLASKSKGRDDELEKKWDTIKQKMRTDEIETPEELNGNPGLLARVLDAISYGIPHDETKTHAEGIIINYLTGDGKDLYDSSSRIVIGTALPACPKCRLAYKTYRELPEEDRPYKFAFDDTDAPELFRWKPPTAVGQPWLGPCIEPLRSIASFAFDPAIAFHEGFERTEDVAAQFLTKFNADPDKAKMLKEGSGE